MSMMQSFRLRERADRARLVLGLAFLVLVGTFFRVQALESDRFRSSAERNRLRAVPLAAPRGMILDRNGLVIAENVPGYVVKLLANSSDSLRAVLGRLATYVPLDSAATERVVERWNQAKFQPATVFGNAPFEVVALLEEHRYELPGLVVQTEPRRHYPAGAAVAHAVGYVGEVSEAELQQERFPGARLGTVVGKDGLEEEYDRIVRGVEGVRYIEVNAGGRMVRDDAVGPAQAPIAGKPLQTRLDLALQVYIDSLWTTSIPYRGAVVAVDAEGGILALYSAPTFDPNEFVGGISTAKWQEYRDPATRPMENRAVRGRYPPASPFKLATAAMALRRGIVTPEEFMPVPCRGGMQFGTRFFRCWKPEGHGYQNLIGAMATSCDVYFYQLGRMLGVNAILEEGTALGFNELSGVDLRDEQVSFMPGSRAWYDRAYGPNGWTRAVELNLAIGQGENDQTLINMVRFYQGVAGDGVMIPPHLVEPKPGAPRRDLNLTDAQLRILRRSMVEVVRSGTAARSRDQDIEMAGKTGTAQNPQGDNHGWFIGYAPAENPKIVVGMFWEHGLAGSAVAPYVARIIRRYLESIDPSLRNAEVQFEVVADTAPMPSVILPDSVPPVP